MNPEPKLHEQTASQVRSLLAAPKGAYIFYGPESVGKATAAIWLAKYWRNNDQASGTDPDLMILAPTTKASLGLSEIQDVIAALGHTRYGHGGHRTIIIDQAHTLTREAQNALLKTLEEPPADTTIILISLDIVSLLPTIRSRAMAIGFYALPEDYVKAELASEYSELTPVELARIANLSRGAWGRAVQLVADPTSRAAAEELSDTAFGVLTMPTFARLSLASQMSTRSTEVADFCRYLARHIQAAVRGHSEVVLPPNHAQTMLAALERFEMRRQAHVQLKAALEGLMLEFAC